MIARVWRGRTRAADANRYLPYIFETGVAGLRSTPGNRGALVFRRVTDEEAEFFVISYWDSEEAIRAFAGDDLDRAVYYPDDEDYLLELEPEVAHYELHGSVDEHLATLLPAATGGE